MDGFTHPGMVEVEVVGAAAKNKRCITSFDGPQAVVITRGTPRKVWTKIILARITSVWQSHHVIRESQHGSIHRRGTASASLQHINAVEDALELGSALQRSSWDFQRVFHTLSRIIKTLNWIRSGLPIDYAEYMVGMDSP